MLSVTRSIFLLFSKFYENNTTLLFAASAQIAKHRLPPTIIITIEKMRVLKISSKEKSIQNPVQYLRWSFSQKQFTAFRNYWFLKSSFLDVWLGSKGASDKLIITFFYSMTQSKFFYFICGAIFLLNRLLAQKISFE